jgi:hypothetical protein
MLSLDCCVKRKREKIKGRQWGKLTPLCALEIRNGWEHTPVPYDQAFPVFPLVLNSLLSRREGLLSIY